MNDASLQSDDSIGLLVSMVVVTMVAAVVIWLLLLPILLPSLDKLPLFRSDSVWVGPTLIQSLLLAMVIGVVLLLCVVDDDIFCGGNGDSPNGVYSPNDGIFGIQLSTRLFIKFVLLASAIKRSFIIVVGW